MRCDIALAAGHLSRICARKRANNGDNRDPQHQLHHATYKPPNLTKTAACSRAYGSATESTRPIFLALEPLRVLPDLVLQNCERMRDFGCEQARLALEDEGQCFSEADELWQALRA